ncbi:MAG: creatininase family protein [Armatimonadota bacterium]
MQESIYYTDLRWPELGELANNNTIILLPLGQVEEHGPHLPVGCDVMIAEETARLVAEAAQAEMPVLVMPTIWTGYSGKDLFNWPGVISLPPELVIGILEHTIISLNKSGFKKVIIMNAHGHHDGVTRVAARKVADQCDSTVVVTNVWQMASEMMSHVRESAMGGCCHACEYETSILLHWGKRVDMSQAVDEPVVPHSTFVTGDLCGPGSKVFWSTWRYQQSQTGTYGCPTKASADKGAIVTQGTVEQYLILLRELRAAA